MIQQHPGQYTRSGIINHILYLIVSYSNNRQATGHQTAQKRIFLLPTRNTFKILFGT